MISFRVPGGLPAATGLIQGMPGIPFCPSLGELTTTLSHPASTSHRGQSPQEWQMAGIDGGTIRLSIGLENSRFIQESIDVGLNSLDF
jgi:cystathionine beta-lyase/cystathionine gamma-synthase